MIKTIDRSYCDLKSMGREFEMSNTTIISMIEEKMPPEMSKEWIKIITTREIHHREKFKCLRILLDEWRNRIEYKIANIRKTSELYKGTNNYVNSLSTISSKRAKCWLHKINGDHHIWRCRLFQNKPVKERIELVKENRACYACLKTGHTTASCTRGFRCTEENCGQPHNRLL